MVGILYHNILYCQVNFLLYIVVFEFKDEMSIPPMPFKMGKDGKIFRKFELYKIEAE
tara:strand:+ start:369 stop:539 length:171 start_codon:yes stop_codon:yes gene_type:complete